MGIIGILVDFIWNDPYIYIYLYLYIYISTQQKELFNVSLIAASENKFFWIFIF